jgi:hypothetical protein
MAKRECLVEECYHGSVVNFAIEKAAFNDFDFLPSSQITVRRGYEGEEYDYITHDLQTETM